MMELTPTTTLVDALNAWNNGQTVFSMDFGRRNRQMQMLLFTICAEQINTTQCVLEAIGDERGQFVWKAWASETLQRFPNSKDYPNAQFAVSDEEKERAKVIAYKFMRYGYVNCLNNAKKESLSIIEVKKN